MRNLEEIKIAASSLTASELSDLKSWVEAQIWDTYVYGSASATPPTADAKVDRILTPLFGYEYGQPLNIMPEVPLGATANMAYDSKGSTFQRAQIPPEADESENDGSEA